MEQGLFQDLVPSDLMAHKTCQGKTLTVSLTLHAIALICIVIVPLLQQAELPEPAAAVKAFFVEPISAAPAPPPPPAPKASNAPKSIPKPVMPEAPKLTAPVEVPEQIKPEEALDIRDESGVADGVQGGVPGDVVGGVVRGLPEAPAPVPPVRPGGKIKEPKKLKNIAPNYPDIAKQARVQGVVILECTISPLGKVTDVKVLRGIPLLDAAAIEAVKQWVYTPTLLNDVPVPVIMTVTVTFQLQ